MFIPPSLLNSLAPAKGFDQDAFLAAHQNPKSITSVRINPAKPLADPPSLEKIPWSRLGYYLEQRPSFTFDPLFHAGCYYVQEASSMFLEQALIQTADLRQPLKVLDLCAAPGGKSTHLQSLISASSLLVSNEVIRTRVNILQDNLIKWGGANVMITNNDPRDLSRLPHFFDIIVVDAPCSGSGLFRREPEAIGEWSEQNVTLCSQRQQRILADIWEALRPGGLLIYSTCSYSIEEDEDIFDWMMNSLKAVPVSIKLEQSWGIVDTGKGYRFWPDKIKGEGFYMAVFQKEKGEEIGPVRIKKKPALVGARDLGILDKWMKTEGFRFIQNDITVYAWPAVLEEAMSLVLQQLHVIYSGIKAGELMHGKLVPDHSMAMSMILSDSMEKVELSREMAIRYLQKKDIDISASGIGWKLACFQGHPLGWMKVLSNRINNYYPGVLRIRKDS